MKVKVLILVLTLLLGLSFAKEKVIIENKGNIYNIKVENLPKPYKKYKHSKKHYKHKKIYKKRLSHKPKYYVASKNGKIFHRPTCKFAKRIKKKIKFKTRKEALIRGLRPCKHCKP